MISKRIAALAAITAIATTLSACTSSGGSQPTTAASVVGVEDNHGTVDVSTPVERIASTDNRTFEVLKDWGITPVAVPKGNLPPTLPEFKKDEGIVDIGNHREPNLEALVAAQPDLIINGQRFTKYYEDIKKLNPDTPVVELEPRTDQPFDAELKRQVTTLGEALGKQDEAKALVDDFDAALERAKKAYNGTDTVMAVNVSGGQIGYVAPGVGRVWGPIFTLLGLKPALEVAGSSSNHEGDDISVEAIAQSNPTWIFALDREAALAAGQEPGFVPAENVIEKNAVLSGIAAVKDHKTLIAPADTYTNESIITYTEILNSIADAFEGK